MIFRPLALLGVMFAGPVFAQDDPQPSRMVNNPADHAAISPGGVDLRTGRYMYSETDLAIGGANQASSLSLVRNTGESLNGYYSPFGNFSSSWDVLIFLYPFDVDHVGSPTGWRATVHFGGKVETFDSSGSGFVQKSAGATSQLTWSGTARDDANTIYTYTANDGTVVVFRPIGNLDCSDGLWRKCSFASSLTQPDGTKYVFGYAASGASGSNLSRLASVTSSRGYALMFEGSPNSNAGYGNLITKACALNLATAPMPGNGICPAGARAVKYGYNALRLASVTSPGGTTSTISYTVDANGVPQTQFTKPGESAPWMSYTFGSQTNEEGDTVQVVGSQTFADGRSYTYSYEFSPGEVPYQSVAGGSYIDNLGRPASALYSFPILPGTGPGSTCTHFPCSPVTMESIVYQQTSGPTTITDYLGRVTTLDYCNPQALVTLPGNPNNRCIVEQLQSFTDPAGIKTYLTYSGRNVSGVRRVAKSGSGLADITISATYNCSNPKFCAKPTSVTDARGNVTNYTYKPENGEVLTQSLPPDANGIRPVKRYAYGQRYAWVSNGSGGFVHASDPVWLLLSEKSCRATATNVTTDSCDGGASDEVITSFDYGPDTGLVGNNLLLRGKTVTAQDSDGVVRSFRSCYGYDREGNKIWETSPRAGLAACY